MAQMLDAKV